MIKDPKNNFLNMQIPLLIFSVKNYTNCHVHEASQVFLFHTVFLQTSVYRAKLRAQLYLFSDRIIRKCNTNMYDLQTHSCLFFFFRILCRRREVTPKKFNQNAFKSPLLVHKIGVYSSLKTLLSKSISFNSTASQCASSVQVLYSTVAFYTT